MKKKLYTGYNEYEDIARSMEFEVVSEVPEVGDAWGSTCEVTGVTSGKWLHRQRRKCFCLRAC